MGEIKAILVGVSDYSQFSNANMRNLPLCINDIMFMEFALVKGLSVKPENIVKLGENGIVTGEEFVRTIQFIIRVCFQKHKPRKRAREYAVSQKIGRAHV